MWRKRILISYLLLLSASSFTRWMRSEAPSPSPDQEVITVSEVDRGELTGNTISLAYHDFRGKNPGAPVIVALHGSPGSSNQLLGLAGELLDDFRIVAPDLPGFGNSERRIPDYSIDAEARYLAQLLDKLDIDRAHLLGFSLGGGVALEFIDDDPSRATSLTLLGSIGVQELELLGDHTLNHAVHGFQLAGIWLLQNAFPHFGAFDRTMFTLPYARSFFDSDQRPLRGILESLRVPTLILHGRKDFLVPVSAAREHARIVPQAELVLFEDGHFRIFRAPGSLARPIRQFLDRVAFGRAETRAQAAADRLEAARAPFDWELHGDPRPISIPIMGVLLAVATWITEDLTCISAGILASKGAIPFVAAIVACFIGIFTGDFLLYLAGRALGRGALRRAPLRWFLSEFRVERSAAFFEKHGASLILTTRFVPGTRLPTYFAAGLLGTGFWRFSLWFLLAAALWVPLVVGISSLVGGPMLTWFERYETFTFIFLALVVFTLLLLLKLAVPLSNHRGRRLLLGRWRRATRWEFWPMGLLYPIVVLSILWQGLRRRRLTLFTAVNPAIPAGGLVGESKSAILEGFDGGNPRIAAFRLLDSNLPPDGRLEELENFMSNHGLSYPVVLKPDTGERGEGVAILRDSPAALAYLERAAAPVIAQEHVPGLEFGIFYARSPDEERGRIISITDKRLIHVTGDGARTLEELILDDDRAVCMAPFFLRRFVERLDEIPAPEETVPLTELGTHCRGALFLDGNHLLTPALTAAVDSLSRSFKGFHFGRYDIRVGSEKDLRAGTGFKVLELNGVTSEATHIYDPRHGYFNAVATLSRQWKMAFDIAAANVRNGARPSTIPEVLELIREFHRRSRQRSVEANPRSTKAPRQGGASCP